jgi:hypothetical protein
VRNSVSDQAFARNIADHRVGIRKLLFQRDDTPTSRGVEAT